MPNVGIIYYADGVKNLYRKNINPAVPVWKGKCSLEILSNRLSRLDTAGSVLLSPKSGFEDLKTVAASINIPLIEFDLAKVIEKPYGLNQQHWFLENSSGNDSWYGEGFAQVFEKFPQWKAAILVPVTNLLVDANDIADSLDLYFREGFEACFAEERIPGAEWAIFNSDLIRGLKKSNPEIMTIRGGLYWAIRKPLYPFKVGAYHCPRIRPALTVNLRLNSLRALKCFEAAASDNFDSPYFSYGDFLNNSGWEKVFSDYAPLQLNIEPSSFCNGLCLGCPNGNLKREKGFLSLENFEKLISDIDDRDMRLVFSGVGEPLLNEKLGEMVKISSDFNITLHTSLQVPFADDFPFESVDHISISIDADNQRSFEYLRKGCSWQNIMDFIEKFSALKENYNTKLPEIGLDYLRRDCSEKDILPFIKKWKAVCRPVFKDNFYRWPYSLKPTKIGWTQISGEAEYCGLSKNTSTVGFEPYKRRQCRNGILSLTLLSDGTLTGCPFDAEGTLFKFGNISDFSLKEIWQSEKAEAWRENHLKKLFASGEYCENCHDWHRFV